MKMDLPGLHPHGLAGARVSARLTRRCWACAVTAAAPDTLSGLNSVRSCAFDRERKSRSRNLQESRRGGPRQSDGGALHEHSPPTARRETVVRVVAGFLKASAQSHR